MDIPVVDRLPENAIGRILERALRDPGGVPA